MGPTEAARARLRKPVARLLLLIVAAGVVVSSIGFAEQRINTVPLQMAGAAARANCLVAGPAAIAPPAPPAGCAPGVNRASAVAAAPTAHPVREYRHALGWDFVIIVGVAVELLAANYLGRRIAWTGRFRVVATVGMWLAAAAAVCNIAQDVVLLVVLRTQPLQGEWALRVVQALAFTKFATVAVAAVTGLCAVGATISRLVGSRSQPDWPKVVPPPLLPTPSNFELQAAADDLKDLEADRRAKAAAAAAHGSPAVIDVTTPSPPLADEHWRQMAGLPPGRTPAEMGICVSGGGVRSATVALGALQSLRAAGQLKQASYLVSVSGGGYTSGAFQLALTDPAPPADRAAATSTSAADVFAPGSVEEDHVRRRSSYLADTVGQWVQALGTLLRNLLASLVILGLGVVVIGVAIGNFYRVTRIRDLRAFTPRFEYGPCPAASGHASPCHVLAGFPVPPWGVTLAIGAISLAAVFAWLVAWVHPFPGKEAKVRRPRARALTVVAGWLLLVGVALPAAVWVSAWVSYHVDSLNRGKVVSAGVVTTGLSYFGSLAAVMWRSKKPVGQALRAVTSKAAKGQVLPYSMVQRMIIWICLLALCLALLLASGWVAASRWAMTPWALLPVAALAAAGALLDQTSMSLHPFYRRRLANTFAVRRGERNGMPVAAPYPYSEGTPLSHYAARRKDHPKVIFACAASTNGEEVGPPGRGVVSYTMADDYIGGPQVGWVPTEGLAQAVKGTPISHDLTVEAAVAISGAAFASAMGRQTRFYELFLCLANARLGAWLPNPRFVWLKAHNAKKDWSFPGLPGRRRLGYFVREIFNIHPVMAPLVLCTDGGHYENLGLVELLRHRCRVIYCIDATGDSPPLATTLAQAIALAWEELGVEITLENADDLAPGGADKLSAPLAGLDARMSKSSVCVATIKYPHDVNFLDADGEPANHGREGTLIVAKACLTPEMPYSLLSFALEDTVFPRDSTGDQWFNGDQFDAYQQLGRFIGEEAVRAAREAGVIDIHNQLRGHRARPEPHVPLSVA